MADREAFVETLRRERQRLRTELKSLDRVENEIGELLHDLRPLADFNAWLRLPGRQKLFDRICRFATPEEWRASVADLASVPWIFPGHEDRRRHLGHCPYCRVQLRLAEGRYRQVLAGAQRLLPGDRLAEELIGEACRDALLAGLTVPLLGVDLQVMASSFDSPSPRLHVSGTGGYEAVNGYRLVPARLEGSADDRQVELTVVAEFVDQRREPGGPEVVFPHRQHSDPLLSLTRGEAALALLVPSPPTAGRYYFRYRTGPAREQGVVRTRGTQTPAVVPASRPESQTAGRLGVVTLDWGG